MKYEKTITAKDGKQYRLANPESRDAAELMRSFIAAHGESENLTSYPEECKFTVEQEAAFIERQNNSPKAIEIAAFDGKKIVGTAGIDPVGGYMKVKHRASFGISIEKAYQGLGLGRALTEGCIECAREAGYRQLELEVVADNAVAIRLYKSLGFVETGRIPCGFITKSGVEQDLIMMQLVL